MPKSWYDIHAVHQIEDKDQQELYHSILAEKKPYFMRYIYSDLMQEYNSHISSAARQLERVRRKNITELLSAPDDELTDEERLFLKYYRINMPVSLGNCVMNRICRRFEKEFNGYLSRRPAADFDPAIYGSGTERPEEQAAKIKECVDKYTETLAENMSDAYSNMYSEDEVAPERVHLIEEFAAACREVEPDEAALCDLLLEVCYRKESTKHLVWEICGDQIIRNMLGRNGGVLTYPQQDDEGDIEFRGERFTMVQKEVE